MRLDLGSLTLIIVATLPNTFAAPVQALNRAPFQPASGIQSPRSFQTCADPSLARTIFQGYKSLLTAHALSFRHVFVHLDTAQGPGEADLWSIQGAVFKAWPTQQEFTFPLFRLAQGPGSDYAFLVGQDAQTPPTLSGFEPDGSAIVAWVYQTPVCGSVPLMSAVFADQTDHYYTTDPDEHTGLLADGWSDGGFVAYVLPLFTS